MDELWTEGVGEYVFTLFPSEYKGVFVDVGAFHPTLISNSYIFEQNGWYTYCIEPNPSCIDKLKSIRKNVFQYACGNINADDVPFYIYKSDGIAGEASCTGLIEHDDYYSKSMFHHVDYVKLRTLDWLIKHELKIHSIDILSIDVEGTELKVLQGLNLYRYTPTIIIIESITLEEHSQQLAFLSKYNYEQIYRISVNDIYKKRI